MAIIEATIIMGLISFSFALRCPRPRPRHLAAPRSTALAPLVFRSAAKCAPPSATQTNLLFFSFYLLLTIQHFVSTYTKLPLENEQEIEINRSIYKKVITAHQYIGKLQEAAKKIPNKNILSSLFTLKEAQTSSCIEGIETTNEDLFDLTTGNQKNKENVKRYQTTINQVWEHVSNRKVKIIKIEDIKLIRAMIIGNKEGFRKDNETRIINTKTGETLLQPINYTEINEYLDNLLEYINQDNTINDSDDFIKLALMHYQFETIHPFTDGNGRTGRMLMILFLLVKNYLDEPILYLSSYINEHKDLYYQYLQECNTKKIYCHFVEFILDAIIGTTQETIFKINCIDKEMKALKHAIRNDNKLKNIKQPRDLIDCLFSRFWITQDKALKTLNISRPTLSKHLNRLVELGILETRKVKQETRFYNKKLVSIFVNKKDM